MGIGESCQLRSGVRSLSISGELVEKLLDRFSHMSDFFGLTREEIKLLFKPRPEQMDLIFQLFDPAKREKIDAFEFIAGMIIISEASLKTKAQKLFNLYDFDHSKSIAFDELIIMLRTAMNALCYMTGSNPWTVERLRERTRILFAKIDINKDATISLAEWVSFVTRDAEFVKILEQLELITSEDKRPNWGTEEDPGMDSDLENETCGKNWERSELQERVKAGVESLDESPFLVESVGEGDQFLAVKPWEGVVKNSVPSNYKPSKSEANSPDACLQLEYVHGYRCHDVRNNLRYSSTGEVVYHTAAVGIVLNQASNTQKHFLSHTDDITAFDISPDGRLAVTGEVGKAPVMHVWDTSSMESIRSFKGIFKRGITNVAFSPCGNKVAGLGADDDHCLAVYDVNNPGTKAGVMQYLVATGKGGKDTFLDIKFHPSNSDVLVMCGVKVFAIATIKGGALTVKKGTGWGKTPLTQLQALSCIGFLGDLPVTGAFNGAVFSWENGVLKEAVKVHESSITCLGRSDSGIVSGGNDGLVSLLDHSLQVVKSYDLKGMGSANPKPRSVWATGAGVLIGTRGGEIYEIKGEEVSTLVKGHFDNELWGLSAHPSQAVYATFGQDGMLGIWDLASRKLKASARVEGPGETLAYSPSGDFLALGLQNGKVLVFDSQTLELKFAKHDRVKAVSQVKYSPDGSLLAAGGHDSLIITYNVADSYKLVAKMKGHTSTVTHMDFSESGAVLQSTSASYDILFHNLAKGLHDPKGASGNRDEAWSSWSLVLGWPVQGIWPPCSDGSDINAVRRSNSRRVVATVDDFSQVKLFRYPCPVKNAACNSYRGHSSHVTNCAFFDGHLITTGGMDKAIFQWKFTEEAEPEEIDHEGLQAIEAEANLFEFDTVGEGDQFLAVKPWLGEMKASTPKYPVSASHQKAPEATLSLLKVHGYRAYDSRNNLKFTDSGKALFPAAGLGIVMDLAHKTQNFFTMHDDDVVSVAIHPSKKFAASGQTAHVGKANKIDLFVWDTETMKNVACLTGFHRRAIRYLDFSPNGNLLLSTGDDDDHSLAVYDWQSSRMVCNSKVDKDTVLGAMFLTNTELVVFGAKFIKFFAIAGQNVTSNRGVTGGVNFEAQMSAGLFQGILHTGTHAGNLFVWEEKTLKKSVPVHTGQVWAMCVAGDRLYTGGSEGLVHILDASYAKTVTISFVEHSPNPGIRALDILNDQLLVGTRGCEIFKVTGGAVEVVQRGHYDGELWGLAMNPKKLECASCGGDKTLRVWDLASGDMLRNTGALATDLRAIDWSHDGRLIVAGHSNSIIALFAEDLTQLCTVPSSFKGKDCWIEDIKFSPDDTKIAFGAHGCASKVEILGVENDRLVKLYQINAGLTSALTHVDWSVDNSLVCVNSEAYELKFVSVDQKKNVASSSVKEVKWAQYTCAFGWSVQYIWPEAADGSDINSVDKAHHSNLLVTADDFGKINLFRWPVVIEKQSSRSYAGHSAHVTKVKFSYDDSHIVSIGGDDKCVFVWKTDIPAEAEEVHEEVKEEVKEEHKEEHKETHRRKTDTAKEQRKERAVAKTAPAPVVKAKPGAAEEKKAAAKKDTPAVKGGKNVSEGAMRAPSSYVKASRNQNLAPAVDLSLEFVHGYRAKDCRNNIRYLPSGKIVYHAAAVGIVHDIEEHSQSFYIGHTDDITSFAISPTKDLIATGEVGRRPMIFVWDSNSLMQIAKFNTPLEKGIGVLAFSPSGHTLVAVAMDDDHSLALYNLETNSLILSIKGGREKIMDVAFISENEFVTSGVKHYKLWTLTGSKLVGKSGQFGKNDNLLLSSTVIGEHVYTGTGAGTVVKWKLHEAESAVELHARAVDSLWSNSEFVVTGSKDGFVHICDHAFSKLHTFDFNAPEFESVCPMIRSASLNEENTKLVVGTFGSEIFEVDVATKEWRNIVRGHYSPSKGIAVTNEVWGLAMLDEHTYATCSDDATLRVWDTKEMKQVRIIKFGEEEGGEGTRARCIHSNQNLVAVGFKDGSFKVYTREFVLVHTGKDRKEEISDVKFSPDGEKLAVGSHDNFVDIYHVADFKRIGICKGHSSYITHFDWSVDSAFIHSNCGAYELLFWDGNTGKQIPGGATQLKDEEWSSWTCVIGWPVQGVYPPYADGTDINAVDRSKKRFGNNEYQVIASADDFGMVKLLRYPCLEKTSESVVGRGHCSHVTNVKFSQDDQTLVSVGGDDQCVFQWKVTNKN